MLFLELNGVSFGAAAVDALVRTLALAAGDLDEAGYAAGLKTSSRPAFIECAGQRQASWRNRNRRDAARHARTHACDLAPRAGSWLHVAAPGLLVLVRHGKSLRNIAMKSSRDILDDEARKPIRDIANQLTVMRHSSARGGWPRTGPPRPAAQAPHP